MLSQDGKTEFYYTITKWVDGLSIQRRWRVKCYIWPISLGWSSWHTEYVCTPEKKDTLEQAKKIVDRMMARDIISDEIVYEA